LYIGFFWLADERHDQFQYKNLKPCVYLPGLAHQNSNKYCLTAQPPLGFMLTPVHIYMINSMLYCRLFQHNACTLYAIKEIVQRLRRLHLLGTVYLDLYCNRAVK